VANTQYELSKLRPDAAVPPPPSHRARRRSDEKARGAEARPLKAILNPTPPEGLQPGPLSVKAQVAGRIWLKATSEKRAVPSKLDSGVHPILILHDIRQPDPVVEERSVLRGVQDPVGETNLANRSPKPIPRASIVLFSLG
jgi:hypothetical protein